MVLLKVEKSGRNGKPAFDASLSLNEVHFSITGMEHLKEIGQGYQPGDAVDIFYDEDTDQIAIKRNSESKFKFRRFDIGGKLRLRCPALIQLNRSKKRCLIERSNEYVFILNPIGD